MLIVRIQCGERCKIIRETEKLVGKMQADPALCSEPSFNQVTPLLMRTIGYPLLVLLILASGCQRYYYRPNAVNTPLFTGGGQAHFAGTLGASNAQTTTGTEGTYADHSTFLNAQAAYSPVNHLAFLVNYSTYTYRTLVTDTFGNVNANAHLLEGALGGYYVVASGKKVKMVTDCYMGYGGGPIHSDVNMKISRFFIQPGIGMRSPYFDAAFNFRISSVNFSHFSANGRSQYYLMGQGLADSSNVTLLGRGFGFFEPAFTIRTGYRFLKIQMQAVFAQNMNLTPWPYSGFMYTAGVYFSLEEALELKKHPGPATH